MEFGYWGNKGIAEPNRWLIGYLGLPIKEWNPATEEEWQARKASLGLFPNLPFLKDGDFLLTESNAIPGYLIKKAGKPELLGKTIEDQARVRQLEELLAEIRVDFFNVISSPGDLKENIRNAAAPGTKGAFQLDQMSTLLGDKDFFLGYLTWADLQFAYDSQVAYVVDQSLGLPYPLDSRPNLLALAKRVAALPGIAERVQASKQIPFYPSSELPFSLKTIAEIEAGQH